MLRCYFISSLHFVWLILISLKIRECIFILYFRANYFWKHSKYEFHSFAEKIVWMDSGWMVTDAQLLFSPFCRRSTILYICIHKFLYILTSGTNSGARRSSRTESGQQILEKEKVPFLLHVMLIKSNEMYICKWTYTAMNSFSNVWTKTMNTQNTRKIFCKIKY